MRADKNLQALLIAIVACLVLIVIRLYSDGLVATAEAQPEVQRVVAMGCYKGPVGTEECRWIPIRVSANGTVSTH